MINHTHKFIFVHIPRTGGTSYERAYEESKTIHRNIWWYAKNYPKQYKNYLKFTMVRNPWDRFVSIFYYHKKFQAKKPSPNKEIQDIFRVLPDHEGFDIWIKKIYEMNQRKYLYFPKGKKIMPNGAKFGNPLNKRLLFCQCEWTIDKQGKVFVDYIGRFENYQKEWSHITRNLIKSPRLMIHRRNSRKRTHYSDYYTEETKQMVATLAAKDIACFNYKFEEKEKE